MVGRETIFFYFYVVKDACNRGHVPWVKTSPIWAPIAGLPSGKPCKAIRFLDVKISALISLCLPKYGLIGLEKRGPPRPLKARFGFTQWFPCLRRDLPCKGPLARSFFPGGSEKWGFSVLKICLPAQKRDKEFTPLFSHGTRKRNSGYWFSPSSSGWGRNYRSRCTGLYYSPQCSAYHMILAWFIPFLAEQDTRIFKSGLENPKGRSQAISTPPWTL